MGCLGPGKSGTPFPVPIPPSLEESDIMENKQPLTMWGCRWMPRLGSVEPPPHIIRRLLPTLDGTSLQHKNRGALSGYCQKVIGCRCQKAAWVPKKWCPFAGCQETSSRCQRSGCHWMPRLKSIAPPPPVIGHLLPTFNRQRSCERLLPGGN